MFESLLRRILYHPSPLPREAPLPALAAGSQEVWVTTSLGDAIHGLYWPPPPGRPTVLFFHGNAQTVFEWAGVRLDLAPLETGMLLIDYPGYGKSEGTPREETLYAAGHAAFAWLLTERGAAEHDIVLFGKSLGGGVATEVAQTRSPRGIVLESTFCSIHQVAQNLFPILPAGRLFRSERYDSDERVARLRAPLLVVHGTHDELIPVAHGEALYARAAEPKTLYLVPGAGHNDLSLVAGPRYGETLRRWLDATTSEPTP